MPIDFPENPGLTPTYQYTYNGITQNWYWGWDGATGVSAWLATGFTITSGIPLDSIFDLSDVTGQNYSFAANNPSYLKWDLSTSSWTPDKVELSHIENVTLTTLNQDDVFIRSSGAWTNQQIPSFNYGQIAGGGVSMTKSPKFAIVAGDSSVTITGLTSDAGITLTITAGAGGGGANPEGPDGSIQFADGSSLSGLAEASVVTDSSVHNSKGYSGNFVFYTESTNQDSGLITNGGPETVPFGTKNIHILDNIALADGVTLDIVGFTGAYTGASMTLILGYTGANNSRIRFPENQGIHWGGGPFGVTQGSDAYIYTRTTPKKYDILYFFADGTRIYGNIQTNYSTSR